jgi:hypothetical protein
MVAKDAMLISLFVVVCLLEEAVCLHMLVRTLPALFFRF